MAQLDHCQLVLQVASGSHWPKGRPIICLECNGFVGSFLVLKSCSHGSWAHDELATHVVSLSCAATRVLTDQRLFHAAILVRYLNPVLIFMLLC